jgi:hypothetical protein
LTARENAHKLSDLLTSTEDNPVIIGDLMAEVMEDQIREGRYTDAFTHFPLLKVGTKALVDFKEPGAEELWKRVLFIEGKLDEYTKANH